MERRLFLRRAPLALVATALPAGAAATPQLSAKQRFDHHLAGLQAAVRELNPEVTAWASTDIGQRWGYGASFLLVGTSDEAIVWGDSIGGAFPLNRFTHDRHGTVPEISMPHYRTPDERYAAMTGRENAYRHWLGMPDAPKWTAP